VELLDRATAALPSAIRDAAPVEVTIGDAVDVARLIAAAGYEVHPRQPAVTNPG
jgi:hypothetical protein